MKGFLVLCICLVINGWSGELLTFRIINNTRVPDTDVYITIYGYNKPTVQATIDDPRLQGFIQFEDSTTGIGSFIGASADLSARKFSYQISSFPENTKISTHCYEIQLPYIDSGEIYFSLQGQLDLRIVDLDGFYVIQEPAAADPKDPNYSLLYDKIALTYIPPNIAAEKGKVALDQVVMDVNAIDFFAIPMNIKIDGSFPIYAGIRSSRPILVNNFRKAFGKSEAWNTLFVNGDRGLVRVLSPGYALTYSKKGEVKYFDPKYLDSWMEEVWSNAEGTAYYQKNVLTVQSIFSNTNYYGLVNSAGNFEFWLSSEKEGEPTIIIPKPTNYTLAEIVFGAITPWPGSSPVGLQDAIDIGQLLQAGIITGYLPTKELLSKSDLIEERPYRKNLNLSLSLQNSGPWYDLYSTAIYPYGSGIYTWKWDNLIYTSPNLRVANWDPTNYIQVELNSIK